MQLTGTEKSILRFFYNFMSTDCLATKAFELNMSFKDLLCDWPRFMDCLCLKRENLWHSYNWQCNFLPLHSQKFLVLILLTSDGLKAESTLEPPRGFEQGTPGLGIQCLNHETILPLQCPMKQILKSLRRICIIHK